MPTETEAAWTAGIIDGEGTCYVSYASKRANGSPYQVIVRVVNTDARMILRLRKLWGGSISPVKQQGDPATHAPAFIWTVSSRQAVSVLNEVRPYLVCKNEAASLCVEMQTRLTDRCGLTNERSPRITPEEKAFRFGLYEKCKTVNKRGPLNSVRQRAALEFEAARKQKELTCPANGSKTP